MSRSPEAAAQSGKSYDQEATPTSTDGPRQAEAPLSRRAGENSVRRVEKVSTSPVRSSGPAKHPHGEFGNVMLTDDEFAKLCEKCQDADSLITELDQYIESQGKTKKYKSHYATLLNWSRRKASESKPQQRYKNFEEQNRENIAQIQRDLRLMFHHEEVESL
jgi:predicted patatin/cPLA2 family phospholipase